MISGEMNVFVVSERNSGEPEAEIRLYKTCFFSLMVRNCRTLKRGSTWNTALLGSEYNFLPER